VGLVKWVILFLFLFSAVFFFLGLFQVLFFSDKRLKKRIKFYLDVNDRKGLKRKDFNFLVEMKLLNQRLSDRLLTKKRSDKLSLMLSRAGVHIKPDEFMMIQWMAVALSGGLFYFVSGQLFFLLIGGIAGYFLPFWWLRKKEKERMVIFNNVLPDMISTIVSSLRAGFSFSQALKTVVEESEDPISEELGIVLKEMQYGSSIEEALQQLKERMPSDDLEIMIQAILIQRQVGGNLAVVLETIVQTIRDRNKIQRQVLTLTAQGRLSGLVIGLLPVVLAFIIYLIEPNYITSLFTHPIGIAMVIAGSIMGIIGFILIRKLTMIEV
jgi:tight adherence protein B